MCDFVNKKRKKNCNSSYSKKVKKATLEEKRSKRKALKEAQGKKRRK